MGASNLGLIFGPTLTSTSGGGDAVTELADMGLQCRIIESLLNNYGAIFDIDDEEEEEGEEEEGEYREQGEVGDLEGEDDYVEGEYRHHRHQQQHHHQSYQRGGMMVHPINEDEEDDHLQPELAEGFAGVSLRDEVAHPNGEYDQTRQSAFEEDFGPRNGGDDAGDGGGRGGGEQFEAEFSPAPQRA